MDEISINMHLINNIIIIKVYEGGYFGFYHEETNLRIKIKKNFPNNVILFFLCSILSIRKIKRKYKYFLNIFNNHSTFTLFIRDNVPYKIALVILKIIQYIML